MLIIKKCQHCNKDFEVDDFDVKRGRVKYCSYDCYHASRKGTVCIARRRRIIKKCVVCDKDFETGGKAGNKKQIFCSIKCSSRARYRSGRKCKLLNPVDASYIAGFLDGEGCIMIYKRREDSYGFRVTITQSQKYAFIMDWFLNTIGLGSKILKKREKENHSNSHYWVCNAEAAESLLIQLLPYLKLKKEQALLGLNFQKRLRNPKLKADRKWQREYYLKMKELNQRGITAEE